MSNFFKLKKAKNVVIASGGILIYTSLQNRRISVDDNILKQYVRKDDTPLNGLVDFQPNEKSYIKWTINIVDAGVGEARLECQVIDLSLIGDIQYEIEGGKYDLGEPIIIENVELPINKDKINTEVDFNGNLIKLGYIDYNNDGTINIVFSGEQD